MTRTGGTRTGDRFLTFERSNSKASGSKYSHTKIRHYYFRMNPMISYNCRSFKRAIGGVSQLCKNADILALQETWLLPFDVPLLGTVDVDFGWTGKSAVDISEGMVKGRPYGGLGLLWRRSVFQSVTTIDCDCDRVAAIKVRANGIDFLVMCVYMPTNSQENLPLFTECLSVISTIISENSDVQAVYVLGDFNAHVNELFYVEMMNFCEDNLWYCADIDMLGPSSDTYTYVSDVYGCRRWLDHCLVTKCAMDTVRSVSVMYDVFWSDHFPVVIECAINMLKPVVIPPAVVNNKITWGPK
jgi:exonuclease III